MHLVGHSLIILCVPRLCIHVNQATPHKDIKFTTFFSDLIMNNPTLFKGNYTGTCIQHPTKVTKFDYAPSCCIFQNKCILPLATLHMSQYHGGPSNHISRWYFVEHFASIFNAPTFFIYYNQAIPHNINSR